MNEIGIKKNKRIITISILIYVFILFLFILINSTFNDELRFICVTNQNTGEPIGVIGSLFLYILLWWFVGLIPSAMVFLFVLLLYCFLHRKDRRILERNYHPSYEEEYYYGGKVTFIATYVAAGLLLILQMFNVITINIF